MLEKSTLHFLKQLAENNNKPWFEAHRKDYEAAKTNFHSLVAALLQRLPGVDAGLAHLQVKDCVFRIHRDVRFSKNKDPFKTNMGAGFSRFGKKDSGAGFYLHCQPGASFIAGGCWMPEAPLLKKIRQEIDYNLPHFKSIVEAPAFVEKFGALSKNEGYLSRPPKGYDDANEALPYLKYKSFVATAPLPDALFTSPQLVDVAIAHFQILQPLIVFVSHAVHDHDAS